MCDKTVYKSSPKKCRTKSDKNLAFENFLCYKWLMYWYRSRQVASVRPDRKTSHIKAGKIKVLARATSYTDRLNRPIGSKWAVNAAHGHIKPLLCFVLMVYVYNIRVDNSYLVIPSDAAPVRHCLIIGASEKIVAWVVVVCGQTLFQGFPSARRDWF